MRAAVLAIIGVVAASLALGCASDPRRGYANTTPYRDDVKSVAAPVFENRTMHPELSARLSEAIVKRIQRATPWAVVREGRADTTLSGAIVDARIRPLGEDNRTGLGNEFAFDVAVDFRWVDNRTGEPILARRNFRAAGAFVPGQGVGEPIETGQQTALETLARDIVAELRSDW